VPVTEAGPVRRATCVNVIPDAPLTATVTTARVFADQDGMAVTARLVALYFLLYIVSLTSGSVSTGMDDLLRLVNAAACIVTNTLKFDRGLTHAQRHDLHWLDASDHITNRLFFVCPRVQVSTRPGIHNVCLSSVCQSPSYQDVNISTLPVAVS